MRSAVALITSKASFSLSSDISFESFTSDATMNDSSRIGNRLCDVVEEECELFGQYLFTVGWDDLLTRWSSSYFTEKQISHEMLNFSN